MYLGLCPIPFALVQEYWSLRRRYHQAYIIGLIMLTRRLHET